MIAITTHFYLPNGVEYEITILRGWRDDNYDPRDFGLDSNTAASDDVASTISQSSVEGSGSPQS
jgi:hypothetical protein